MTRHGYVSSTTLTRQLTQAPPPGSFDERIATARKLVLEVACQPRTSAARTQANDAALAGAKACDAGQPLAANPHLANSVEAAAWLLGWHARSREEE